MKPLLFILSILTFSYYFGQENNKWVKQTVPSPQYELQQIEYHTYLLDSANDSTHYFHYYNRGLLKYRLRDYYGAIQDVNKSLLNNTKYCDAYWLRATLKLKLKDRNEACKDFKYFNDSCDNEYNKEYQLQCDLSWDYSDTIKVHYEDTTYLRFYGESSARKEDIRLKGNDFITYYDTSLTQKKESFYIRNDTNFYASYFANGQIRVLNKTYTDMGLFFYEGEWCENGQMIFEKNPNSVEPQLVKRYNCNGTLEQEYYSCKFGLRGLYKLYHQNGEIAEKGHFEKSSSFIGQQKAGLWLTYDLNGNISYETFYQDGEILWNKKN